MSSHDKLKVSQEDLVQAWGKNLPLRLNPGDQTEVMADEADPRTIRVHIQSEGRQMYDFDFAVQYVDSREVDVQLVDVEKNGQTIDERSDVIQELIRDYRRHLHECAQALQEFTHA